MQSIKLLARSRIIIMILLLVLWALITALTIVMYIATRTLGERAIEVCSTLSCEDFKDATTADHLENRMGNFSMILPASLTVSTRGDEDYSIENNTGKQIGRIRIINEKEILKTVGTSEKFPTPDLIMKLFWLPQFGELYNVEKLPNYSYPTWSGLVSIYGSYENIEKGKIEKTDTLYMINAMNEYFLLYIEDEEAINWDHYIQTIYFYSVHDTLSNPKIENYSNHHLNLNFSYFQNGHMIVWQNENSVLMGLGANPLNRIVMFEKQDKVSPQAKIQEIIGDTKSLCKVKQFTPEFKTQKGYQYWFVNYNETNCKVVTDHYTDSNGLAFFIYNPELPQNIFYIEIGNGGYFDKTESTNGFSNYIPWIESLKLGKVEYE